MAWLSPRWWCRPVFACGCCGATGRLSTPNKNALEVIQNRPGAGRGRIESELGLYPTGIAWCRRSPGLTALLQLVVRYVQLQQQLVRIDGDRVVLLHQGYRATHCRFRRHMPHHHAPGTTREAAIGDQTYRIAQAGADEGACRRQHLGHAGPALGSEVT